MITAIPMNNQDIAQHFSKALSLAFFDERGNEIHREPNPALDKSCAGKAAMLNVMVAQKAERVLVRHIGEKMLARLLNHSLNVFQMKRGRHSHHHIPNIPPKHLVALTDATQGSPSINNRNKQAEGGQCCEQHQASDATHHTHGKCCNSQQQSSSHGGHQRRCCH
ncbi:hypothetical protein K0504_16015 [Neiella marina]|uniref:Dinitrogenase iron-molybdenum cofactor biosynthesis domain-containing protein n=1 Tax=Neiella holothuriorum TaxID=2870530 RepID=A0ABS7EJM0_9GAMM|nr:NifB/NifX family molybdenum-iron cluster-binding protein [Neiella holothuriorum]MBW8192546.1 hypothetical protein [Neiella holothuriorum]